MDLGWFPPAVFGAVVALGAGRLQLWWEERSRKSR